MMKEILITSSALILALLVIRQVFRGVLSRRVQYALWALVLVRLLVPVSLPAADFSVLTATEPVQQAVAHRFAPPPVFLPVAQQPLSQHPTAPDVDPETAIEPTESHVWVVKDSETAVQYRKLAPEQVLTLIWKCGMAAVGAFFLVSNLNFYRRLRRSRRELPISLGCAGRKVYRVEEGVIPSPCLFGRSIYITPAVAADSEKLRHVLTHEATHARHLDPVWSLLRCVCLTVYWFDPLVWVAAACSKTDCELACDESVLKSLGEDERIPYGQTLLSLIPVKRVGNPLLTATTMAAGKKQLKDRITRIARRPRQLVAAALAVAVLAGVVSACTFTGAKPAVTPTPNDGPQALTSEELRWFNQEFFNGPASDRWAYNIRNQFANPINLYDRPEDIDLYELFYLEGTAPSDGELQTVFDTTWDDLPCPAYVLTTAEINDILMRYTGLTLDKANKESLTYTYDAETDAYYWMHGDTNYCVELNFTCGTRDGETVRLYHNSNYTGGSWYCVTLEAQADGGYWFRSNQTCEAPAIPTPLPSGEPAATLSLDGLTPYVAPTLTVERRSGEDFKLTWPNMRDNWNFDGHHVGASLMADGLVRAAVVQEDGALDVFLTLEEGAYGSMSFYHGLFGHDGFYVDFVSQESGPQRNYYYFTDDGVLTLLLEATTYNRGGAFTLDLDGDGHEELIANRAIFFQREGNLYKAQLDELLLAECPELDYWDYESWNIYSKCLYVNGAKGDGGSGSDLAMWERYLYFDGENILVYTNEKTATDHVVDGAVDAYGVPDVVVQAAKDYVLEQLEEQPGGTWRYADWREYDDAPAEFDDWRIESFTGSHSERFGDTVIEGWAFNYELHATDPSKVVLAGGRYLTEDGWASPGYPGCDWLFFKLSGTMNENREFLWGEMNQSSPDSWGFKSDIIRGLERQNVTLEGTTVAKLQAEQSLAHILDHTEQVQLALATPDGRGGSYQVAPDEGNAGYYRNYFSADYNWAKVEASAQTPAGTTLIIADRNWYSQLQFWEGSDLVMYKTTNDNGTWFKAETAEPKDSVFYERCRIFPFMRQWFDEVELDSLRSGILIPNEGQGPLAIVRAWAERYEGAMAKLTPGSSLACTFVKVVGEGTLEDMPDAWFPQDTEGHERFAFTYEIAFVPETEDVLNRLMAGNTGEYEGGDPEVPEGAFSYNRRGSMYLHEADNVWVCAGVGTG